MDMRGFGFLPHWRTKDFRDICTRMYIFTLFVICQSAPCLAIRVTPKVGQRLWNCTVYIYAGLSEDTASLCAANQAAILSLYATADMGIHYDGWTLDDTATFFRAYGFTDEETIRDIFELIVGEPANYLKYYIGYLEFHDLQEDMKKAESGYLYGF